MSTLLDAYTAKRSPRWSPSTRRNHAQVIADHLKPALGDHRADRLRVADVEDALAELEHTHAATYRKAVAVLRAAYEEAIRRELVDRNPARYVEVPTAQARAATAPTVDQLAAAVTRARTGDPTREGCGANAGLAVYIRLAAITGERRGELLALRWRDTDLATAEVFIRGAVLAADGVIELKTTKTGKSRPVAIDAATVADLTAWRRRCRTDALALGRRITIGSFVLSQNQDGTVPWWPDTVSSWWRSTADAVGLTGVRLHDLRHTMVSTLVDAGCDPRIVADRAGHSSTNVTLDVYSHARCARDHAAAELLAGRLDATAN